MFERWSHDQQLEAIGFLCSCVQACFVLAVIGSYVLQYMPMLRRLNAMLKRTRGMLLLFPEDVMRNVDAIRAVIQDYSHARLH